MIYPRVLMLFYHDMDLYGGAQSAAIRIAGKSIEADIETYLICRTKVVISEARHIKQIDIDMLTPTLSSMRPRLQDRDIDILAFAPTSGACAALAAHQLSVFAKSIRFSLGVFHPRDFNREREKRHVHFLNSLLLKAIGVSSLHFMNEECRTSVERFLRKDLTGSRIVAVPIDNGPRLWGGRSAGALRIVSVGRLVPFKSATLNLPSIISSLPDSRKLVELDIFGYGPLEDEMKRAASSVTGVRFLGILRLDDFPKVVSTYDLFIGMGTAALQAAQLGVPTLMTTDNDPESSYGFIKDLPFGNVGEHIPGRPKKKIEDLLSDYVKMSSDESFELSRLCEEHARKYTVDSYVEDVFKGRSIRRHRLSVSKYLVLRAYEWMSRENWLRSTVRGLKKCLGFRRTSDGFSS